MTELRSCPNGLCVLSGGVGGAKLVLGLSQVLNNDDFMTIVNTGDDFVHLGLKICPDIDTIIYTLAELVDQERGWGLKDESWNFLDLSLIHISEPTRQEAIAYGGVGV